MLQSGEWRSGHLLSPTSPFTRVPKIYYVHVCVSKLVHVCHTMHHEYLRMSLIDRINEVNLLKIHAAHPDKHALALCDTLFSNHELVGCCYKATKRSTKTPPPWPQEDLTSGGYHPCCTCTLSIMKWYVCMSFVSIQSVFKRNLVREQTLHNN